jgi:hypothetical protein
MKDETIKIGSLGIGVVLAAALLGGLSGDWHTASTVATLICMGLAAAWFAVVR